MDFYVVRTERIELSSRPWEGHILPLNYARILACQPKSAQADEGWSHLGDSNPGPPLYESGALAS